MNINQDIYMVMPKSIKKDVPLRLIISQCPAPTYNLAKFLNKLIAPYCQSTYSIKSSEFIDLINSCPERGNIASLG